jgi:enamine deaminase RidA (YjgF/YER057c/UK114 family)
MDKEGIPLSYAQKLTELGLTLPPTPKPVAAYVPAVRDGNIVYTSGQIAVVAGELKYKGKLGRELTIEQGYEAARICALNALAAVVSQAGSIENIEQILKVVVFVASAPGFTDQPKVANGASELLGQVFGAAGQHARSAVGVAELPLDTPVEVELVVKVKG